MTTEEQKPQAIADLPADRQAGKEDSFDWNAFHLATCDADIEERTRLEKEISRVLEEAKWARVHRDSQGALAEMATDGLKEVHKRANDAEARVRELEGLLSTQAVSVHKSKDEIVFDWEFFENATSGMDADKQSHLKDEISRVLRDGTFAEETSEMWKDIQQVSNKDIALLNEKVAQGEARALELERKLEAQAVELERLLDNRAVVESVDAMHQECFPSFMMTRQKTVFEACREIQSLRVECENLNTYRNEVIRALRAFEQATSPAVGKDFRVAQVAHDEIVGAAKIVAARTEEATELSQKIEALRVAKSQPSNNARDLLSACFMALSGQYEDKTTPFDERVQNLYKLTEAVKTELMELRANKQTFANLFEYHRGVSAALRKLHECLVLEVFCDVDYVGGAKDLIDRIIAQMNAQNGVAPAPEQDDAPDSMNEEEATKSVARHQREQERELREDEDVDVLNIEDLCIELSQAERALVVYRTLLRTDKKLWKLAKGLMKAAEIEDVWGA